MNRIAINERYIKFRSISSRLVLAGFLLAGCGTTELTEEGMSEECKIVSIEGMPVQKDEWPEDYSTEKAVDLSIVKNGVISYRFTDGAVITQNDKGEYRAAIDPERVQRDNTLQSFNVKSDGTVIALDMPKIGKVAMSEGCAVYVEGSDGNKVIEFELPTPEKV